MKKLLVIPVTAAALTLSLSACGGDSDDAGGSSSPSSGTSTSASPGGGTITGNGGGTNGGGSGGGTGGSELTPAQKKSLTKLVECMRKKGYEMPEPTSPAIAPKNVEGKDPDKVNKDSQECAAQSQ
ncbi:hypothetical protein E1287_22350 [Actinomadura sp. KC06]|uniref:hypothetical protein n=1 Tax=Actinomadura sp. KC06 TaxID=2530369 RepID=UPI001053F9BA|nr:hypothetical protein [Actinomadura sp. KC06]TDD32530.1 hypothetical protein E1287_22350 [Actinomadura sp. KC06]